MAESTRGSSAPRRTTRAAGGSGEEALDGGGGPIEKAFQLLDVLVDAPSGGTGVREISRRLSLPVSSVHRLLGTLLNADLVSRDEETRRYSVGPEAYRLAARITRGMRLSEFALPALRRLTAEFNETALLGVYLPQQGKMMFTDRVDGTHFLQYRIALLEPLSLVWGASGKAILAFLPPEVVDEILKNEGPSPATGARPPRRSELLAELDQIRSQGYVISHGEKIPNARGVAAPVFGASGVVGCLCVTSPVDRLPDDTVQKLSARVAEEATQVSELYGGLTSRS
ncbi:transcriptional regulator, IclR family [Pseudonocardia thermophila]|uniref:Transcriptional regulator, IclR family n=1 Tax=Pseudonocardia thermophila TaxID=1848 RepID=A0A1M7AU61_PSETH|nr:IclR family transcriptional regulator [Pseudonocardia thermophila]SHL46262.1 transcriptional regulator, IclR family [Pseudonocardia thermophila]